MVQFVRLRLQGFKSFVDSTELAIQPGMTGIVGPNGCGKSNLVEALKWVMGETSAKQMRGSEMEDVIFAGAGTRPGRNIAEVLAQAGAVPEHLTRLTWYVTDKGEYIARLKEVGQAYRRVIGRHFPAMTLVQVVGLLEDRDKVEIEATAVIPTP